MNPAGEHTERMERVHLAIEGLSAAEALGERFFRPANLLLLPQRLLPEGPWPTTDDTEMALGIAEVLSRHGRIEQEELAAVFARRYALDPGRGYGGTAHRILTTIGEGVPWRLAAGTAFGGMGSMGNGGAMRAAPVGAYFAPDRMEAVVEQARLSAEVTHTHPEGQAGAVAVAVAAAWAWQEREHSGQDGRVLLEAAIDHTPDGETREGLVRARRLPPESSVMLAVSALGNGSKVLATDTVPFALWCAARHADSYEEAVWTAIEGGGDIDTTAAIVGGILALRGGREAIPAAWLEAREPLGWTR